MPKYKVPLRVVEVYDLEITADSKEEATKIAIENSTYLEPDDRVIELGKVEDITPPSAAKLEATYQLIVAESEHPARKATKAMTLLQDVKKLLDLAPGEDGCPSDDERARLATLQRSIAVDVMGLPPEALEG